MRHKALSPRMLRQLPLTLAGSLAILMACSQLLLVQSTSKSTVKYSTWSIRSAIRLASLRASLLRPLTPGALAATPCSAVLAYRPRSWPRVAGDRLAVPASMAASTAARAFRSVWRICAAQGLALRVGFPDRLQGAHQMGTAELDPADLPAPA